MKLQKLLSYVRRAVDDYHMIEEGDRIAVGVSGGKDSICLLIALKHLQRFYPKRFKLEAITVSLGLPGAEYGDIQALCDELGVHYSVVHTDIGQIIFEERKEKNPCSLCAKMRKGALNTKAEELGCNKVALGHNKDDVVETFFMSLFYEGRINCFSPVSYLDRSKLYSIRPLMYIPEWECRSFVNHSGIQIVKNPCLADGNTKRQETKELLAELSQRYDNLQGKVFSAIQRSKIKGWNQNEVE
ncbi:tRNA 2-thiocytidine biosynthesis protein TtcA [Anaerotignum lactatifermentans]|uniref:tRNA 2-thiocytidine biosynthesis protein TtcA n=1 Tax=Anaerotignum lactatifermentans TaxID=160404 RepID=A0ABS2G7E9_9FIRM|nr:tRNA 2-thiocytidine biosynthesis TtcA family protein [Anaerotignum lactatifermentans]MBM6828254.1 tRNA 2-thiocytidine biosynthesis protein TtcA [Anaerotignum lactatifermentans]MBM6876583.1 tRNA 2-thiocytidine biosynthesis protein TtcA [Anaerotignum lactatifermentans]MBM6949837.1 tRNA 2-thiocytidine biosynthesis protein TtcA [Anaerotignum lactatifermentans]